MNASSRASFSRSAPRARRSALILLVLGSLLGPTSVRGEVLESCLVRSTEPTLEWTLVEFRRAHLDSVVVDLEPLALPTQDPLPLLAFEAQPVTGVSTPPPAGAASFIGPQPGGNVYVRAWLPITIGEFSLLCITALLPKDFTGWSADFVDEGAGHFAEAWTKPPVWDTDHWFHNYVGHPYGGSFYYNSVRSRGASPAGSMAFAAVLSAQWEYIFEAVAERPSIQDLVVTPVTGWALGELTHRMSNQMRKGQVTLLEKVAMTVLNPADVLTHGYKSAP